MWKSLNNEKFGLMNGVSDFVSKLEFDRSISLPNLTKTEKIYIFSDYGGEHKNSDFISYAFLITDWQSVSSSIYEYNNFKRAFNLGNRIISYKKLNDNLRFRALSSFLSFSDNINGIIVIFLIQKEISSIFEGDLPDKSSIDFSVWKSDDFEKLMRIIHLISLFINGLTRPMQDVCWITDQDNIVVNDQKLISVTQMFGNISSHYLSHNLRKLQCGRANIEKNNYFEVFCSIPDLIAGGATELLTYYTENNIFPNNKIIVPSSKTTKSKVNTIIGWFMNNHSNLKKLCISLTKGDTTLYKITHLKFHNLHNYLEL
jgi:hypothetical protein